MKPSPGRCDGFSRLLQLTLVVICFGVSSVQASNWAQMSGVKLQDVTKQSQSLWAGRWGHAMASFTERGQDYLVILGGDSYQSEENVGELLNDVWKSRDLFWKVVLSTTRTTQYGAPLPQIISQMLWDAMSYSADSASANRITYHQLLCCDRHAIAEIWPCDPLPSGAALNCDPFVKSRIWSPRRSHVAVTVNFKYSHSAPAVNTVVVLGGRARFPGEGVPDSFIIGHTDDTKLRDKNTLMNDVWVANTTFSTWHMYNPGCFVHNSLFLTGKIKEATCSTDRDCYFVKKLGSNGAQPGGTVKCENNVCVCKIWTPRERFAASVLDQTIYLTGGVTEVTRQRCGEWACGSGNREFLNDVWSSSDLGRTWTEVFRHDPTRSSSGWRPRGDHASVMLPSGVLYLLGGRTGDISRAATNPLLNDVWSLNVTQPAAQWHLVRAKADWSPRAGHIAAYSPFDNSLLVYGGEEFVSPSPSPSPLVLANAVQLAAASAPLRDGTDPVEIVDRVVLGSKAQQLSLGPYDERFMVDVMRSLSEVWSVPVVNITSAWTLDFSNQTYQYKYVSPNTPLTHPSLNFTRALFSILTAEGITTLQDLADASVGTILRLKQTDRAPMLCYERMRAVRIVYTCSNKYVPYDGEFMKTLRTINGATPDLGTVATLDSCTDDGVLPVVSDDSVDYVCYNIMAPKRHAAAAFTGAMGSVSARVYVSGGWTNHSSFGNDMWYRDNIAPITRIRRFPSSGSSDTVFNYNDLLCDGCVYSYRLFNGDRTRMLRNWSLHAPPMDYKEWLSGGLYYIEFRAMDAAGNRDLETEYGRNSYAWRYVPPLPWLLIILGILLFIAICVIVFIWYRRRQRRIALERYALKRARRKLKAAKTGDWRTMYDEDGNVKKSKKKGKGSGKGKGKGKSGRKGSTTGRSTTRSSGKKSGRSTSRSRSSKGGSSSRRKSTSKGKSTARSKSNRK